MRKIKSQRQSLRKGSLQKISELEQKHEFANSQFLKHFAQVSKLLELMVKDGQAKVKPADKMLMVPALFDGEKSKKADAL